MTPKELAELLHGNIYGEEISPELETLAKENGLVVIFGASDDTIELRGAIHDEVRAYPDASDEEDSSVHLTATGLFEWAECSNNCSYFLAAKPDTVAIKASWGSDPTWQYETKIPHATFGIWDDEEYYCQGIVFRLSEVAELCAPAGQEAYDLLLAAARALENHWPDTRIAKLQRLATTYLERKHT